MSGGTGRVATWNADHPVGTPVRFWPGGRVGEGRESFTRSAAWDLGSTPVVSVEGYAGGIALSHVEVRAYDPSPYVAALIEQARTEEREQVACEIEAARAEYEPARGGRAAHPEEDWFIHGMNRSAEIARVPA